ncbi:MAG: type VI secretion system baseplate subunit TssF [bacterium]
MMEDDILHYYEQELTFIRAMGAEFARKYPKIAGRLLLEPDKCEDPHTERLIEAFALLCARIQKKVNDDFPEITGSLLNILYPHYIAPIPSLSVVKFEPLKTVPPGGYRIEKNTALYSKPVSGFPCQFSTTYPVTLWPVEVVFAGLKDPKKVVRNAQQALVIKLKTLNNLKFSQIGWESVRFFLNGQGQHVYHLYELLFNNVCHVECETTDSRGKSVSVALAPENIKPVGFAPDEWMLPYSSRSFPGYILLFEYFCFPEKFLFFDLDCLDKLRSEPGHDTLDIWIYLNRPAKPNLLVNADTFCLSATPVVNLFRRIAEPIRLERKKPEYLVVPDSRRAEATEIYSVDQVAASMTGSLAEGTDFSPFYSLRHHLREDENLDRKAFWHVQRRPSGKKGDNGTEIFLSFTDWNLKPTDPGIETLTVYTTCTNRDLPARLPFGDPEGDFEMETSAPVARINCLIKPTPTRRPPLGGGLQWRLVSHLSLNYLSLVQGGEDALREILRLYDFDNSPVTRQQINGIVSVRAEPITRRIGQSFGRGIRTTIQFDEDRYVGTGLYLFASVLERFLGQYVSVNSFSQLVVKTLQKSEVLKKWPPRNGNRILL